MAHTPQVFLSFAGTDRSAARRISDALSRFGVATFVDEFHIDPGGNFFVEINRALTESDYFVLLWSEAAVGRPWVLAEVSAALALELELRKRRSFVCVVRLDLTELPPLLAPRRCLDVVDGNITDVVNTLATAWSRDRSVGLPVFPVPCAPAVQRAGFGTAPTIELYIRNRDLSVAHLMRVPAATTGLELARLVRTQLVLPEQATEFGGAVGLRFFYSLLSGGTPIHDETLTELGLSDFSTIDLEVEMESFGPSEPPRSVVYRHDEDEEWAYLPAPMIRSLVQSAFAHLTPQSSPSASIMS